MTAAVEDFQFWRDALAGKKPPVHDGKPQVGYFERRLTSESGTARHPVMVQRNDAGVVAAYEGTEAKGSWLADPAWNWPSYAARPIPYETWLSVFEGRGWPDETVTETASAGPALPPEEVARLERAADDLARHSIGGNNPPSSGLDDVAYATATEMVEAVARDARVLLKTGIRSAADADRFANIKDRAREAKKSVDAAYETEWRPLDNQVKAVRAKWSPLQDRTQLVVTTLLDAITRYQKAEGARRQAEAAAQAAAGAPIETIAPVEPVRVGGASGRKTGSRTVRSAEITDYAALLEHLKEQPAVRETVQKLADVAARGNITIPGMKIVETQKAT